MPDWFADPRDAPASDALRQFLADAERPASAELAVRRRSRRAIPATDGRWRSVASRAEITPEPGIRLSGLGPVNDYRAHAWWGRLWATTIVLDDGAGGRAAIVAFDLHAATRPVLERIAHRVAASTGIGIDNLFGAAIHTHCGPGNFYGDRFYDEVAGTTRGFRGETVDRIVDVVACAIEDACAALDDGRAPLVRIGYGEEAWYGSLWNRSVPAFLANFGVRDGAEPTSTQRAAAVAWATRVNGAPPPPETWDDTRHDLGGFGLAKALVDARVRVLWVERLDGVPVAGLAFTSATPTFLSGAANTLTGDLPTAATLIVRSHIRTITGFDVPFAFAGAGFGDTGVSDDRPLPAFYHDRKDLGHEDRVVAEIGAAQRQATRLARAAATAWDRARADAAVPVGPLVARMGESEIAHPAPDHGFLLAEEFQVGISTFAASELDHNRLLGALGAVEGRKDWENPALAHRPKLDARFLGLGKVVQALVPAGPPAPFASVRVLRLGRVTLVGLPGEATAMLARRIEERLAGDGPVIVAGLSGDYLGYFVTQAEYDEQQYEGASCLWGRQAGEWILAETVAVAEGRRRLRFAIAPFSSFENPDICVDFYAHRGTIPPESADEPLHAVLPPRVVENGGRRRILLQGTWSAARETTYPALRGPWVGFVVLRAGATAWEPLRVGSTPVTDAEWPVYVRREQAGDEDFVRFRVATYVPWDDSLVGARFSLAVTSEGPGRPIRWEAPVSEGLGGR